MKVYREVEICHTNFTPEFYRKIKDELMQPSDKRLEYEYESKWYKITRIQEYYPEENKAILEAGVLQDW